MNVYKPYRWVFVLAFLLVVAIIAGLMRGKEGKGGVTLETILLGDLVQRIDDFNLTRFKGEDIEWDIKAKRSIVNNEEDDAGVKDIDITYIPEGGTPVKLSAEKGRYNIGTNSFSVEKVDRDVDINIGQGLTIKGSALTWSEEKREIYGPGRVHVIGNRFLIEGEDLVAHVDNGIYEIRKDIRATMW